MLTTLFHWDYWTIDAQPVVFLEELTARLNAETAIKKREEAKREAEKKRQERLNQMRLANKQNMNLLMKH